MEDEKVPDPMRPTLFPQYFTYPKTRLWPPSQSGQMWTGEPANSVAVVAAIIAAVRSGDAAPMDASDAAVPGQIAAE
jgi:hypothetical protein